MNESWSSAQQQRQRDDKLPAGEIYCPWDHVPLEVKAPHPGDSPHTVTLVCPRCGNTFPVPGTE